ncbi:uncharacterized protein PFL1_05395 [Pseudozyma flocculosa PF-1]|uniref:Uncharacterized protein n=1 Tax=Pseudozyma flocculosa PF-1 TaxID=1277687 RepID=A0A061H3L7_9BASI|nr:uncharacterized protein PFL1_05395 [Pseudozyma flocculosa PF-1]EPQ27113.1 hypothetical protein PFL1_05395 [Pseudozyma flocculosa PF-1]
MAAPPDRATEDAGGGSDAQLPDLSTDTTSASIVVRPSFEQLNATLFSRGYLRAPLNVAGLPQHSVEALADALHAIIAQREEDLEVRSVLTAKTRTLTASLERAKRFLKDEGEKCADSERKAEAAKAKAAAVQHALQAEQLAHKATKDALTKSRRELQLVKASALQHRASSDRNVARVRARIGEVTGTALRLSVPDFRIVSSAFDESLPGSGSAKARAPTLAEEQVEELERNRAELVDYNRALKRLATEAINAVRRADAELLDMVEAEEQDSQKKATAGAGPSASSSSSDLASSSYGSGGASQSASKKRASTSDAWLQGHGALFQRDLFPAAHPLTTAAAAAAVAGASGSRAAPAHPALQALSRATDHFADHVQTLLDLRTTRLVHEAESRKRDAIEAKESSWQAQLHSEVKAEIEGDAQFSVNRHDAVLSVNGALTANKKQVWQEEKKELERKLLDTVKRLAVAEQNVARREKELRKLEESERRARRLIDEQQRQQQQQPTAKEGDKEGDGAKAGKESSASNIEAARNELQREFDEAKAEKRRYAKLSETLERDREQLERAREKLRAERAESRAMSAAAAAATTATQLQQDQPAPARRTVSRLDASEMPARPAAAIERLPPVIEGLELSPAADEGGDKMELDDAPAAEAVPALSPSHPATAELAVAPAGEAPGSAVATGSNPELDAIFGRAFSALATTSMSSPPSTAKAATRTPVEKPRRQSSRLSSSSSTPPTSDVVAAESAAVPTTEKRKSRRISERSEDRHEEAATVSEGSERKRRRVETESSLAERRSSNSSGSTTGRRSRTEDDGIFGSATTSATSGGLVVVVLCPDRRCRACTIRGPTETTFRIARDGPDSF